MNLYRQCICIQLDHITRFDLTTSTFLSLSLSLSLSLFLRTSDTRSSVRTAIAIAISAAFYYERFGAHTAPIRSGVYADMSLAKCMIYIGARCALASPLRFTQCQARIPSCCVNTNVYRAIHTRR